MGPRSWQVFSLGGICGKPSPVLLGVGKGGEKRIIMVPGRGDWLLFCWGFLYGFTVVLNTVNRDGCFCFEGGVQRWSVYVMTVLLLSLEWGGSASLPPTPYTWYTNGSLVRSSLFGISTLRFHQLVPPRRGLSRLWHTSCQGRFRVILRWRHSYGYVFRWAVIHLSHEP